MAYDRAVLSFKCGECDTSLTFTPTGNSVRRRVSCVQCGAASHFKDVPTCFREANLPDTLLVGADRNNLLEVCPVPQSDPQGMSDMAREAPPYSVRSFVAQASAHFRECEYSWKIDESCGKRKDVNTCKTTEGHSPCHLMAGFSLGQSDCPLSRKVTALCQTPDEKWFLNQYLRYVRGRPFPMLIPQCRLGGITQSIRPDFVVFVPLQSLRYRWLAIQLDANHSPSMAQQDEDRDARLQAEGYEVRVCRGNNGRYLEDVKHLVEDIEKIMTIADTDPASVAVPVTAVRLDPPRS
jgi:hypothetical protein